MSREINSFCHLSLRETKQGIEVFVIIIIEKKRQNYTQIESTFTVSTKIKLYDSNEERGK